MGAGGCCQGKNVEIKDNTFFRQKTIEKSKYLQDIRLSRLSGRRGRQLFLQTQSQFR
jgi:hypothetical protein